MGEMDSKIIVLILGMAVVTFLPRFLPMALMMEKNLPEIILQWLRFFPIAILTALLAPIIFVHNGMLNLSLENKYLIAIIPTAIAAFKTRNVISAMIIGVGTIIILNKFL